MLKFLRNCLWPHCNISLELIVFFSSRDLELLGKLPRYWSTRAARWGTVVTRQSKAPSSLLSPTIPPCPFSFLFPAQGLGEHMSERYLWFSNNKSARLHCTPCFRIFSFKCIHLSKVEWHQTSIIKEVMVGRFCENFMPQIIGILQYFMIFCNNDRYPSQLPVRQELIRLRKLSTWSRYLSRNSANYVQLHQHCNNFYNIEKTTVS